MTAAASKPVITRTRAVWRGDHRFDAGPEGRVAAIDADAKAAPGPVETLLNAIATCSAVDVLDILAKRRTPASGLEVRVDAPRRQEAPRRVERLDIEFHIDGSAIEPTHAEYAIGLSFEKYCSVAASLAPDIAVWTTLVLNGERGKPQRRMIWQDGC
jgi:putative redox protein